VTPVVELTGVSKDYRALRPLRIERLTVSPGERVAILGLDLPAAETLLNLVTGTTLPDRGSVEVFGRPTASIGDSADWLSIVDRFGIVTERAVLLDALTVIQNLALPLTVAIEPPSSQAVARAAALADEVGLSPDDHGRRVGDLDVPRRARVRLARALALDPEVLLLEHASAGLTPADQQGFAADIAAIARRRGSAVIAATADGSFARAVADRVLTLNAASGALAESSGGWFRRRRS
jgi:ABC-type transporter Mla maintaining outer membrane lipid asymmetry ATPase subunit MlaF